MSAVLWEILEILVNYYQGFMEIRFVNSVMKPKVNCNKMVYRLAFSFIIGTVITFFNQFTLFEGLIGIIVYWMCSFCYAMLFLDGSIIMKLFYSSNPVIVLVPISSLSLNFVSSINNMSIEEVIVNPGIPRFMVLFIAQFLFYVVLRILSKMYTIGNNRFDNSEFIIILVYLFFTVLLACLLHIIAMEKFSESQRVFINLSLVVLIVLNITNYIIIGLIKRKNLQIQEYKLNKLHDQYQKIYIEETGRQYDSIIKIKHDIKNQLLTIYRLIDESSVEETKKYISENIAVIRDIKPKIYTQNEIVNAVVNTKLTAASAMGIDVHCVSINEFDGVSNIDWCNLLSNMLDNAINGCNKLPNQIDKHIDLSITRIDDTYTVITSNTIHTSVLIDNPNLCSTKTDGDHHGIGTKIIKGIAAKYNGTCLFYEDNNTFICKVIIKI